MGHVPDRLSALARATRAAGDLDSLLEVVVEHVASELGADGSYVGRLDPRHGNVDILARAGAFKTAELWEGRDSYPIADHARAQAVSEEAQLWSGTLADDLQPYDHEVLRCTGQGSAVSVPIVVADRLWGVLYATRTPVDGFDEPALLMAALIGELLAAGISRVDDHPRLRTLAYTDPLTRMANRRAVDEQLLAWAGDAASAPRLTVVLCDVNKLKVVNDRFGHPAGDRLLRQIGVLVSTSASRFPGALAGRIGGDEFLLAIPDAAPQEVDDEMGRLVQAAAQLGDGDGLSYGVSSRAELDRLELTPAERMRALLRLADAEQYRRKLAGSDSMLPARARDPGSRRTARDFRELADAVNRLAQGIIAAPGAVGPRLARVAATVCATSNGAAWWVSAVDGDHIVDRFCGTPRDEETRDGEWRPTQLSSDGYRLGNFPATAEAVKGGSFVADALHGDDAERRFLAQTGFRVVIAAGGVDRSGDAWLVEVFGDSLTPELQHAQALLMALTSFALRLK
jgi:diguanylate cyclase (GGDEF)-like protein